MLLYPDRISRIVGEIDGENVPEKVTASVVIFISTIDVVPLLEPLHPRIDLISYFESVSKNGGRKTQLSVVPDKDHMIHGEALPDAVIRIDAD